MGKVGKGFAAVLFCLVALAAPAVASDGARKSSAFAREYGETLPPIGYVEFCQRHAEACEARAAGKRKLAMNDEKWLLVRMVNAFVNGSIAPITDETLYGTAEYWTIPADAGDCEDLVLLKRKILQQKGIPAEALRITVVLDEQGEGHAVLTLVTTRGDFILDNRRNDIRNWHATNYTMLKRQSAQDPRKWVSLEPSSRNAAAGGTASK
jgi:predicted transglutaminase-like cysteine proteinase